ncbi:MAG: RNA polymerase factor sigma-54 [Chitinophagales bacterium]|jgi:RNA polymerase sigma-54 factor|nr:RNA polymerase factor sigma-54 [Chitinophagales bacterium]
MLKQGLEQKQKLKISQQLLALYKMMELNSLQIDQKIQEELLANPALEIDNSIDNVSINLSNDTSNIQPESEDHSSEDHYMSHENDTLSNENFDEFHNIIDKVYQSNYDHDDDENGTNFGLTQIKTDFEMLTKQVSELYLTEKQTAIAEFIIGNLDEDGLLRRDLQKISDDLAFRQNLKVSIPEIKDVLDMIKTLEPPGIGSQSIQECLLIQLDTKVYSKENVMAYEVIDKYFDLFTKRDYAKIAQKLKISNEAFSKIISVISSLNPKPININSNNEFNYIIIPDFFVYRDGNKLRLELHQYNMPTLRISDEFTQMLMSLREKRKESKENASALEFVKNKVNAAQLFITSIKQRHESMIIIMNSILKYQKKFFLTLQESDLKPMTLKNISEATSFNISTISRITNLKYVWTEVGVFPLKFFFSEKIENDKGVEISTTHIKNLLKEIVENEDKTAPYSDEELVDLLKKNGAIIARRTVAKYRDQLNILPRFQRKQLTK